MTTVERKDYLARPFLNKNIFVEIVDLPEYAAKRMFNSLRHKFVDELKEQNQDTSLYDNVRSNYLPTDYVLEHVKELQKYVHSKNGVIQSG